MRGKGVVVNMEKMKEGIILLLLCSNSVPPNGHRRENIHIRDG